MANLLSILIWLPIIGGIINIALGNQRRGMVRFVALVVAALTWILSLGLWIGFDTQTHLMQFVEKTPWVAPFGIEYYLGVDGISMPLIILTTFSTLLVVIAGWKISLRPAHYFSAFLLMEGLIIGIFSALDAVLFYVFWEASLIPMLLIIGIWGGERRVYAAIKFFLYTFIGSVLMLVAMIYLFVHSDSFAILNWHNVALTLTEQSYIFWAFFLAFAVKIPMFPVHTWLPDAHVEAPTGGSVILAAIMLKVGGYGFFRFSLPIAPDASLLFAEWMILLSLIAIIYIGFIALVQKDMKKLIAYSSISHMGFVTLGVFALFLSAERSTEGALLGLNGALIQMVSHGFVSAALFLLVGVLYDRLHSRLITTYGGVVNPMPKFTAFAILFAMANAGLPATSGFVGELMVILGAMHANFWYAFFAAMTLIIGAAYTLWMVKRVFWGKIENPEVAALSDLNGREFLVLSALAVAVLAIGVYPDFVIEIIAPSAEHLLNQALSSKL